MELNFASIVEVPLDWHWWPHQFPGRVQDGQRLDGQPERWESCSVCQPHCTAASAAALTTSPASGLDPIIQVIVLD